MSYTDTPYQNTSLNRDMIWQLKRAKSCQFKYPAPKWVLFAEQMIALGATVSFVESEKSVSKYVTVNYQRKTVKVRFSNHKPSRNKELLQECDYYAGVSNYKTLKTTQIIELVAKDLFNKK